MGDPNYPAGRRAKVIKRLQCLGLVFETPIHKQYVDSTTTVNVKCKTCDEIVSALPQNLIKRGGVHCKACRYAIVSEKMRLYTSPDWFVARYRAIYQRCFDKNSKHYKNYGGRGISLDFPSPDKMWDYVSGLDGCNKNLTIDRIDNNSSYKIGNLRWASRFIQNINTRRSATGIRRVNGSPRFQARITKDSKEVYLGTFDTYKFAEKAVLFAINGRKEDYESRI